MVSLYDDFEASALNYPEKACIVYSDDTYSYQRFFDLVFCDRRHLLPIAFKIYILFRKVRAMSRGFPVPSVSLDVDPNQTLCATKCITTTKT